MRRAFFASLLLLGALAVAPRAEAGTADGGYWLFGADGGMFTFGDAAFHGSLGDGRCTHTNSAFRPSGTHQTCTDMAASPTGNGYWLVDWDCNVYAFGDAKYYGGGRDGRGSDWIYESLWDTCYIAPMPSGRGYWLANSHGGVKAFGDALPHGDATTHWHDRADGGPGDGKGGGIVGIVSTAGGDGYWMLGRSGKVYPYGSARHLGDVRSSELNQPVIGMAPSASRQGYWIVAGDGGIFSFGDAPFYGSTGNMRLNQPVYGMSATASGRGYWLFARDGGIFTFGDAKFHGSTGDMELNAPIIGMASR